MSKTLVQQVDDIIEVWELNQGDYIRYANFQDLHDSINAQKYEAIALYDHIVKELTKPSKYTPSYYIGYSKMDPRELRVLLCLFSTPILNLSYKDVCQAMLDSKKMKPYLNLIFGIDNE